MVKTNAMNTVSNDFNNNSIDTMKKDFESIEQKTTLIFMVKFHFR